jgi:type VI secretion system protein ImpE
MSPTISPEESIRAGRLGEALQTLQQRIRTQPGAAKDRIFLFQVLALLGQWERAAAQLKVAGELDSANLIMVQIYRHAITAELLRARVFDGTSTPVLFGEPDAWLGGLLQALQLVAQGHYVQGAELREQALQQAPASTGTLNGERFEWLADGDSRLGPCLEIIVDGKYMWTPFERVRRITMEPPTDLRDLVWAQAIITWSNAGQTPALIPTRYWGTEANGDDQQRLARKTDWVSHPGETYLGLGQRMLATDAGEYPLLEVREIAIDDPAVQS